MIVLENTLSKKQSDYEELRQKLSKQKLDEEKYLIRDRQTFERQFGLKTGITQKEEKVNNFTLLKCIFIVCDVFEDV